MKYFLNTFIGITTFTGKTQNILLYFLYKPLKILFGKSPKGMMNSYQESKLLHPLNKGLVLNGQNKRLSVKDSYNHLAVFGISSIGKTSAYIIPNILQLANTQNSIIVTDLSGEIYKHTSGYMKQKGFNVLLLDPEDLQNSIYYNPLYYATNSIAIDDIAETLKISAFEKVEPKDEMWYNGAKTFIAIYIKLLLSLGKHQYINLANLKHLLDHYGQDILEDFIGVFADDKTARQWQGLHSGHKGTTQAYISNAQIMLSPIAINDNLAQVTSKHTINFENFRKQKTILYIKIAEDKQEQYKFLLNIFYKQFFSAMMKHLPSNKDLPIYCLLDEFGNMRIPKFNTLATTIRKYKVSLSILLQDYSQLESVYGEKEAKTIKDGGISSKLYFAGTGLETAKKLSESIGYQNKTKLDEYGELRHTREPILAPDEIITMEDDELLYFYRNKRATKMTFTPFYKDFRLRSYTRIEPVKQKYQPIEEIEYIDFEEELKPMSDEYEL